MLVTKNNADKFEYLTTCYPSNPGPYGWCATTKKDSPRFDVGPDIGWGYCTESCTERYRNSLDFSYNAGTGKERKKRVTVIDQGHCEKDMVGNSQPVCQRGVKY